MSDASTRRMLTAYLEQSAQKAGFFTQFFTPTFHTTERVEVDIRRSGAHIAPVLRSLGEGLNRSECVEYVNKDFLPAVYGEEFSISTLSALKRQAGNDPFQDVNYLKSLQGQFQHEMTLREEMIRRGVELQCAQVLTTGVLALPGVGGASAYDLDFKPKTSHFPGATQDWDENSGTARMADVSALCEVIWQDGQHRPKYAIFGESALRSWFADPEVQAQIRKDGTAIGSQVPPQLRNGGVYHGTVSVGQFVLEMWTAPGVYKNLTNGNNTKYMPAWKVAILSEGARLDLAFGDIPSVIPVDPRLAPIGVGRVSSESGSIDLISNAWFSPNGRVIHGSLEARPLAIPTAIDTFGTLNAKVS